MTYNKKNKKKISTSLAVNEVQIKNIFVKGLFSSWRNYIKSVNMIKMKSYAT